MKYYNEIRLVFYWLVKRVADYISAILMIVILMIPITLIYSICVLFSKEQKHVFFKQERLGKNGKIFMMYKFCTMEDEKITDVGLFLRAHSFDEVPAAINILLGQMSLIGPRPSRPFELTPDNPHYAAIISVRPGITGLWQVSGRHKIKLPQRYELEAQYIKKRGLVIDTKIFFKSFNVFFTKGGL